MSALNDAQQEAVTAGDGPALVLAGAGSGKTRVIVERIIRLIEERGVDPRSILALTFTNRAANEMRARVMGRLGVDRLASWVGTFHGFGLFVLRRDMDRLGREKTFTIFDDADQLSLMKRLIKDLSAHFTTVSPRDALEWISALKQKLAEPDLAAPCNVAQEKTYRELWVRYHRLLLNASAVDFDDLLALPVRLFEQHPDVLAKYQRRYCHVLIDEYQDTNRAQYQIAKLLTQSHKNIFAVGDEDQSIYSWRGAEIRNILDFEKDFEGARVFRLEQNYRSTQPILDAANAVVENNEDRLGKTLWTARREGEPARFYLAADAEDEARFVIEDFASSGVAPRDAAILYRTNGQSRVLEEAFRRKGIAYVVVGGVRFYGRKEIKDLLCYLRLLVNPADDDAVRRVLNVPPRGIGNVSMERIEEYAAVRGVPLLEVLREIEHDHSLQARTRESTSAFVRLIDDLTLASKASSLEKLVESILEKTGYRDFTRESDEKDFRSRLENVDEFLSACKEFDKKKSGGVIEFLQELALFSDVDEWDADTPAVTLMTCHSAKGLEFESVYLVGMEEGLLPHATAMHSDRELEEERRLCYVAMTRARTRLVLTAAESRIMYGESEQRAISRFIQEIPGALLRRVSRQRPGTKHERTPLSDAKAGALRLGTRVRHATFGEGYVLFTSGSGATLRARIRFKTGRVSTFMVGKAPLEILEGKKR
jgi:DNA helicase-2/ATP-dependent DNA helicase PcrA